MPLMSRLSGGERGFLVETTFWKVGNIHWCRDTSEPVETHGVGGVFETPEGQTSGAELCVKLWPRDRNLGVMAPQGVRLRSEEGRGL